MHIRQVAAILCAAWGVAEAWPKTTYVTEDFASPGFKVSVMDATEPGYLFFATIGTGYLPTSPLITDNSGELIWAGPELSMHDFRIQSYKGKDVITYWSGYGDSFGHGYGSLYIMDDTYSVIHTVCLSANIVTPNPDAYPGTVTNPCFFDSHEAFLTDRGTMIGTAYNVTQADLSDFGGPEQGWVFDALFFEVDIVTQEIVFQWSALEHIPLTKSNYVGTDPTDPLFIGKTRKGDTSDLPWDFFHINSVQPVQGGYIVNSRMTWSFYMVKAGSGNVEWTLEGSNGGSFELGPGIFWSWQHMARVLSVDGDVMHMSVFNNDNINHLTFGTNQTTGYLLKVDPTSKQVTALRNYKDDADPVFAGAEGSYQALSNGHVFMGYGSRAVMKEFDKKGKVVYNVKWAPFSKTGADQDRGKDVHSYRSYRYNWKATPYYPPKVAANSSIGAGQTDIYMSWNGATNYDGWNIYGGKKRGKLDLIASGVARHGFETKRNVVGGLRKYKYVQVEALHGQKVLSTSKVMAVQGGIR